MTSCAAGLECLLLAGVRQGGRHGRVDCPRSHHQSVMIGAALCVTVSRYVPHSISDASHRAYVSVVH